MGAGVAADGDEDLEPNPRAGDRRGDEEADDAVTAPAAPTPEPASNPAASAPATIRIPHRATPITLQPEITPGYRDPDNIAR